MKHFIRLEELLCEPDRLTYKFSSSLEVFNQKSFFIEYDRDISDAPESIRTVPFAAVMAPIAQATGAELILPSLDEEFAKSLDRCGEYFKKWFSKKWLFTSRLDAPLVRNEFTPDRYAMLFSGGLDSLATYIRHKDKQPLLFTVLGADIPLSHNTFIQLCKEKLEDFARKENVSIRYIRTDVREMLDSESLKRYAGNWYGDVAHGLMLSSLIAPATYDTVKSLMLASCSHRPNCRYTCGSQKELIQEISWGGTSVENDNHELNRCEKIRTYLKQDPRYYSYIRVCWMQFQSLNCSRCEKCLRTICELLMNNIDPARCNFIIDADTLPQLKKRMLKEYYFFFRGESALDFWRTIQEDIRIDEIEDRYGAREFFRWFSGFEKIKQRQNPILLHLSSEWMNTRTVAAKPVKNLYNRFKKIREEALLMKRDPVKAQA